LLYAQGIVAAHLFELLLKHAFAVFGFTDKFELISCSTLEFGFEHQKFNLGNRFSFARFKVVEQFSKNHEG
jgi:hypothetical protein